MATHSNEIIKPTIDSIPSIQYFKDIVESNTGTIVIKFGADWCGPCKKIDDQVHRWFDYLSKTAPTVQTYLIDIDDNIDVYSFLKTKKMVNGIPAILVYKSPNKTFIPDDTVLGANAHEIDLLFRRL